MKKTIALIIILIISNIAYSQQDVQPDTSQNNSGNNKSKVNNNQLIIETGYSWGIGEWGQSVFRLNFINSLKFSCYSVGIGTGFSILNRSQNQYDNIRFNYQVPIFLDNRVSFSKKRIRPYLSFGIGLSFVSHAMLADLSLFINSSTGVSWKINDKVSLIMAIAYESYNVKYDHAPTRLSHSLGFSTGISF